MGVNGIDTGPDLRNVSILPQHYTASEPRIPRIITCKKSSKLETL